MSNYKVTIGLSNKHLHLSAAHIEALFGAGHKLTPTKDLRQPGQFACEEKVDLEGPKGVLKGLRVLGPARPKTQIELSLTDARGLGIKAPVRESGKLDGSPGCRLTGPGGSVELDCGVIVALRHVHLSPAEALDAGVKDKDVIRVRVGDERAVVFENVLVRAGDAHLSEFHLDTDEGNAAGVDSGQEAELLL
ncbi:MAG: phosphate propanoyltransferase [Clostridiales Family XIII bacterium]|jgi:putative phosphotransacetylase|nr:phosphate propanoyltransferase [Clostridiales Family XIII bacterium]